MKRTGFILLWLMLIIVSGVAAQDDPAADAVDWRVVLHDADRQQLVFVTAAGITDTMPIPTEVYEYETGNAYFTLMVLSPDARYLALPSALGGTAPAINILIADLQAGTCCTIAQSPIDGVDIVTVGVFSPDSSQLAVVFGSVYSPPAAQSLAIIDVASGAVIHSVDPYELFASSNVHFGDWTADGILLHPNCFACEGVWSGYFDRWNPETDALEETLHFFNLFGDRLALTGEMIEPVQHPDFPITQPDGMFPFFNAIAYLQAGYPPDGIAPVVFDGTPYVVVEQANPDPAWVLDGHAFFLPAQGSAAARLVFRDGSVQLIEAISLDDRFLAGTPDGWLMLASDSSLMHYTLDADQNIGVENLTTFTGDIHVLQVPSLGASVETPDFTPVEADVAG